MNSIQRADMAVIGTWRDNIRTDEKMAKAWMAKHGMDELVNDVIARCPTKTIQLKQIKNVKKGEHISSVAINDTQALEIDNKDCVRCMHCINVMSGALATGTDKGASILVGGKRTLKIGDLFGTVIIPFMKLETEEDRDVLVDLGQRTIDFFAENALEHERTGEMIERIGLVNFLEAMEIDVDATMIAHPRTNPYVRTDGWDEEVAKTKAKKLAGMGA
jgi:sulfite reductase alpha subunit